jgi:hypothetical protein
VPRVVFDPRLLAPGIAFAPTLARQLVVLAAYGKLVAAAETTDAALAASVGGTLQGAPPLGVSQADVAAIASRLPPGLPTDVTLVASRPLLDACEALLVDYFDMDPPLRAAAAGLRVEPLVADLVGMSLAARESQDPLLYCGLQGADLIVSDHHPVSVKARGVPQRVTDPYGGRTVTICGQQAFVAGVGPRLLQVDGLLLTDICALLRP